LEELDLGYTESLTLKSLERYKNLKKLSVMGCKWLTEEDLKNLPVSLEELDLGYTESLTLKPLERYKNLKKLSVMGCEWLTEEELKYFSPFKIYA
jgi:Leucine-rich repeat (LRR) protein